MTPATQLPEYWRRTNRQTRRLINWTRIGVVLALTIASVALVFTGATEIGLGDIMLGKWMIIGCAVCAVVASAVGERP